MTTRRRVVVLGAGFGGLLTALKLSKRSDLFEVVLVDKQDRHVYKPWLYDVATSLLIDPEHHEIRDLARSASFSIPDILKANKVKRTRFLQAEVSGIDPHSKHVLFTDGKTLSYDALVIAVGAQVNYFGIEGMEEGSLPLSGLQDAMEIRATIGRTLKNVLDEKLHRCTIAIVGGGPTGTESATELANFLQKCDEKGLDICRRCRVVLIEAGEHVLGSLSRFSQDRAKKRLDHLDVEVHTNTMVTKVVGKQVFAKTSDTKEELVIPYDVLIWAGGVRPHDLLTDVEANKTKRGRMTVDGFLRVEGLDDVFALGDCAAFFDRQGRELPPTAWAAIGEATTVAKNIMADARGKKMHRHHSYRHWPAVITTGGKRAIAEVSGLKIYSRLAFGLRRIVDLRYFLQILPWSHAVEAWRRGSFLLAKND